MKLAILSCGPNSYSTRRFREACEARGYDVRVLNTLKFAIDLERGSPDLYYRQKRLSQYDAVLPRIGASITCYGTAAVRQFQQMGVYCANTAHGIANSRAKLRSLQLLNRHHIGIPKTNFVRHKRDVLPAIERVGGARGADHGGQFLTRSGRHRDLHPARRAPAADHPQCDDGNRGALEKAAGVNLLTLNHSHLLGVDSRREKFGDFCRDTAGSLQRQPMPRI